MKPRSDSAKSASLAAVFLCALIASGSVSQQSDGLSGWTIFITNDSCPDYTWGFDETQTRKNIAELVRSHLDEMSRADEEAPENQDRYNMAVTQEVFCFLEHYPDRKQELIRRMQEGRIMVSPFLCNSLWAFQSVESAIRTMNPARRLERDWGIPIDVATHIELPSVNWGIATILAGSGVRWLNVPFLDYDSTFSRLKNPPLFFLEGPDGSRIRVILDAWASRSASYSQGARLLNDPALIPGWINHYKQLGAAYPARAILASGTHSDTAPGSASQTRGFAQRIKSYNDKPGDHPKLINAHLAKFCKAIDHAQAKNPFMPVISGCFGHSWDLWPVSLAKYAADMRQNERSFLAAETLLALAIQKQPKLHATTQTELAKPSCGSGRLATTPANLESRPAVFGERSKPICWNATFNHCQSRTVSWSLICRPKVLPPFGCCHEPKSGSQNLTRAKDATTQ